MGKTTTIGWTDSTWNPWVGCTEVSPGCDHCYARTAMEGYGRPWELSRTGKASFYGPLKYKQPRRIFTCSWSDFFHPRVPEKWQRAAWDIMLATPQHVYQVLTKRPGRMAWWAERHGWPGHIWAGTSVESAKYLPRLDVLARVPAKVRFLSAEPLLGAVDLRPWLDFKELDSMPVEWRHIWKGWSPPGPRCSWVIVGGESGPKHRPMEITWLAQIAAQCQQAGVAVFVKQDSARLPGLQGRIPDYLWALKEMPLQATRKDTHDTR